jgi:hypothetical protein
MNDDAQVAFGKVIAKAWSGADFKQRHLIGPSPMSLPPYSTSIEAGEA